MRKARASSCIALTLGALSLWSACVEFTVTADSTPGLGDARADAPTTSSSSSSSSSSSGEIPPWVPSWYRDSGAGIPIALQGHCVGIGGSAGTLTGTYKTVAGCFDKEQFTDVFDSYCPGVEVRQGAGLVDATLTVTGTSVVRSGDYAIAGEIMAPCKTAVGGSCSTMKTVLSTLASQNGAGLTFQVECYDFTADACVCQMEVAGIYEESPFTMDASAGTLVEGSKILRYGLSPAPPIRVTRVDKKDDVPFENALVLDYSRL